MTNPFSTIYVKTSKRVFLSIDEVKYLETEEGKLERGPKIFEWIYSNGA